MAAQGLLTSTNVIFQLVDSVGNQYQLFPAPEQVWRVLVLDHKLLVMCNDVVWPEGYFDGQEPSDGFVADIESLIDCLALDQRPDNRLIVHASGGAVYRRRVGRLPQSLHHVVMELRNLMKPRKKLEYHQTYRVPPDKPPN